MIVLFRRASLKKFSVVGEKGKNGKKKNRARFRYCPLFTFSFPSGFKIQTPDKKYLTLKSAPDVQDNSDHTYFHCIFVILVSWL